ncbi:MAG: dTDP-glucose 4,6-dehydratase [Chlamydiae bacterium]|nr:dTDP-glucose 4,6-dehydratase [Chlamydiota bacterium]MBI3277311.1 dTDP-glucose 4,6-dehydratase [Chlamydiota bacterium]
MSTYLITGGAGFIGSNFVHYLLKNHSDTQVINFDKLTYAGNLENLRDVEDDSRYQFVKGDIADQVCVEAIFKKGIDVVVNFAAETHVDRSIANPTDFIQTDVFGAYTLLESARKYGVKKFIQISTDEVYGSIESGSFRETDALMPRNPYSASKAGADRLAYSYWATYELPVIITRASNNFGPYQYPEKFISLGVSNLLEGKPILVYGDGKNIRDWLYVEDHCSGIDHVIRQGQDGEVYNIAGGNERENIEIAQEMVRYLGKPQSSIQFIKDRLGHDRRYSLNADKLKSLGWQPKSSFLEALHGTIDWYRDHGDWWKKIKTGEFKEYYKKQYELR